MLAKNAYDIDGLREIGGITARILDRLRDAAQPGVTTLELDMLAARLLEEAGAASTPAREYRFPGQLCISVNDEIVHGIPGNRVLRGGDLVKLDLTADRRGFVADATRMVALPPVTDLAANLARCAEDACRLAIENVKPGMALSRLGGIIQKAVTGCGFSVIRDLCGHGVGRKLHEEPEVPNFNDRGNKDRLERGSVITIEPIICAGRSAMRQLDDGWTLVTADGSLAAHYEETLIVTRDGAEVVTTF